MRRASSENNQARKKNKEKKRESERERERESTKLGESRREVK